MRSLRNKFIPHLMNFFPSFILYFMLLLVMLGEKTSLKIFLTKNTLFDCILFFNIANIFSIKIYFVDQLQMLSQLCMIVCFSRINTQKTNLITIVDTFKVHSVVLPLMTLELGLWSIGKQFSFIWTNQLMTSCYSTVPNLLNHFKPISNNLLSLISIINNFHSSNFFLFFSGQTLNLKGLITHFRWFPTRRTLLIKKNIILSLILINFFFPYVCLFNVFSFCIASERVLFAQFLMITKLLFGNKLLVTL